MKCSALLQSNVSKVVTESLIMLMPEVVSQLVTHSDVPVEGPDSL